MSGVGVFATTDAQDLATFELAFSDTAQDDGDGLTVLFTNDVHGAGLDPESEGLTYASVAALEKDARIAAGSSNVMLVDAGDAVQGNAIATLSEGDIPLQAMLESGYDLMVPGNHEFDYGTDRFLELAQQAEEGGAAYMATNIRNSITDEPLLHPGWMGTCLQDGELVKVTIIGITTPETLTKSHPSNFQDEDGNTYVDFYGDETGEALYERVQATVDAARKAGSDYVVAVGHLGNQGVTPRWSSKEVIANTSGIDVLIDGHSHEQENEHVANAQGDDVLLVQTGTQLSSIGKLTLNDDGFDAEFITADDYTKKDADVNAALKEYQAEFADILNEEVAESQATMPWETNELMQMSGMTYTIDTSVPSGVVTDASGAFAGVNGERRVKDVMVGGKPLDPEATYTVASHNYLLIEGGSG